jgi:hypothetical protein
MIPKVIRTSWKSDDILRLDHPMSVNGIQALIRLNPDWKFELHLDSDVEMYLKDNLDSSSYEALKDKHIVEKTDVWRLIKMYNEGGCYVDIDRLHDTPLSDLLDSETKCVLPTCRNYDFSQDFMLSAPGNPIYMTALKLNIARRNSGHSNLYFLGAQTFMHAVTLELTGKMINVDPGKDRFDLIRESMSRAGFIRTFEEDSPIQTVTFRNPHGLTADQHESLKRSLYSLSGTRHWTDEW